MSEITVSWPGESHNVDRDRWQAATKDWWDILNGMPSKGTEFDYRGVFWDHRYIPEWVIFCNQFMNGCYSYFVGNECLYVGQSRNLTQRIISHINDPYNGEASKLYIWPVVNRIAKYWGLNPIEWNLIRTLKPKYNKHPGNFSSYYRPIPLIYAYYESIVPQPRVTITPYQDMVDRMTTAGGTKPL